MNKSLFQLSAEYQQILDKIYECEEVTPELMEELNAIHDSTENKILARTSMIKQFESEAKSIEEASNKMFERYEILIKNAKKMRDEIKKEMEACHIANAKNAYHEVKIMLNNPKVSDNIDENLLPSQYFREKMSRSVDRITILRDLKEGIDVPGATMVRETRLQIR